MTGGHLRREPLQAGTRRNHDGVLRGTMVREINSGKEQ